MNFSIMLRIVAFFALLASFFANARAAESDFSVLKFTGAGKVDRIIDPQTLSLEDGRIIWLAGLDFPDNDPRDPGEISLTAMAILEDFLIGRDVKIYQTGNKNLGRINRMGHHIAHLIRKEDGNWVQGALLSLGLARVRTTPRTPEMAAEMLILESQARAEKIGLWEKKDFSVLSPENAGARLNSFQIVEGIVQSVSLKKNRTYLNFGPDWRTDFTVMIAPMDKRKFLKAGLDPQQWNRKKIRVRGWLESYNGPMMELDHPESVELLFAKDLQDTSQNPIVRPSEKE